MSTILPPRQTSPGRLEATPALLFLLVYLPAAATVARLRPLWEDEMFTLALARIGSPRELWGALLTGADQHPFAFYRLSGWLLGTGLPLELALRWPSVLAGAGLALVLYAYVAPRTSPVFGVLAMLLVTLTAAWAYAIEARGYALLAFAVALAFLAWQGVGRRTGATVVLAAAVQLAIASHYYAVLALLPIALGEAVWTIRARRLRVGVWLALVAVLLPLAVSLPLLEAAQGYAATFWGKPSLDSIGETYETLFLGALVPIGALCLVAVGCLLRRPTRPGTPSLPVHESIALVGLALLPVWEVVATSLTTHAYAPRYALPSVVGVVVLLTIGLHRAMAHRPTVALAATVGLAGVFLFHAYGSASAAVVARARIRAAAAWLAEVPGNRPLVGWHPGAYLLMAQYGPPALRQRVHYLADTTLALRYLHQDTADRGLPALRAWLPDGVVPYRPFVAEHPRFLLYGWPWPGPRNWILPSLRARGVRLTPVGRVAGVELYEVDLAPLPTLTH